MTIPQRVSMELELKSHGSRTDLFLIVDVLTAVAPSAKKFTSFKWITIPRKMLFKAVLSATLFRTQ